MDVLLTDTCQSTPHEEPQGALSLITAVFLQYLTIEEGTRICQQFHGNTWRRNSQVLWSGIPRDHAQQWADKHDMQTLPSAMGPLMIQEHPLCVKMRKSKRDGANI